LGISIKLTFCRDYKLQVFKPHRELIDPYHPFGAVEIDTSKGISHKMTSSILFIGRHAVFKIEDYSVGLMKSRIYEEFRLISRGDKGDFF
jgi:hypothetical protein